MRLFALVCGICLLLVSAGQSAWAAELEQAEGAVLTGTLLRIEQNQFAFQTAAGTNVIPAAEIIRVTLSKPQPDSQTSGLVILANGDRIHATILKSEEEAISVRLKTCAESGEWNIPLETIQAVFFHWPAAQQTQDLLLKRIAKLKQNTDLFYLKNGDFLEGEFLGFDDQQFRFESNAGETAVPRSGIAFFRFNPELINFPQPDRLRYRLELIDGTRLTVAALKLEQNQLTARTLFGATFLCQQEQLASITPLGGRAIPLSSLVPSRYLFTPYLTQSWDWHPDRNATAGPLRVGGTEYVTGLGMHSAAELHFDLDGNYTTFLTDVGIDDATNGQGSVDVSVLVDQRVVFMESVSATGQRPAISIPRVDLKGSRELVLKVDFGKNADIQDLVNWCRPLLVRKK